MNNKPANRTLEKDFFRIMLRVGLVATLVAGAVVATLALATGMALPGAGPGGDWRGFARDAGAVAVILLPVCVAATRYAAYLPARRIARQIAALRRRVETPDAPHTLDPVAAADMPAASAEMAGLFKAVAVASRDNFAAVVRLRAEGDALRARHRRMVGGLLGLLRSRLPHESPLLPLVGDFALVAHAGHEAEGGQGDDVPFDLRATLDRALADAKRLHPVMPGVHLVAALQAGAPRHWLGQPRLVEALLRHLLLIGLRRTPAGLVCLRLDMADAHRGIRFTLEDSGPEIAPHRLRRLLDSEESALDAPETGDLSWMVLGALQPLLEGEIETGGAGARGGPGLLLAGGIRLKRFFPAEMPAQTLPPAAMGLPDCKLVLIVEDDPLALAIQRAMLEQAGCHVFAAASGGAALEWAALLPLSAIMLDTMLPDMRGPDVARRLQMMMVGGLMPRVPCWALTAVDDGQNRSAWREVGIATVLLKPVSFPQLTAQCAALEQADPAFYHARLTHVEDEFPPAMRHKVPALRADFMRQVASFAGLFEAALEGGAALRQAADEAHAVKSAALSLGYHRLAAFAGQLEYLLREDRREVFLDNRKALAACFAMTLRQAAAMQAQPEPAG